MELQTRTQRATEGKEASLDLSLMREGIELGQDQFKANTHLAQDGTV